MNKAFDQDHTGQRVKVAYPGDHTVYRTNAAYITFNEKGELESAREATDEEVRWWLSLQHTDTLNRSIQEFTERLIQLLQRSF